VRASRPCPRAPGSSEHADDQKSNKRDETVSCSWKAEGTPLPPERVFLRVPFPKITTVPISSKIWKRLQGKSHHTCVAGRKVEKRDRRTAAVSLCARTSCLRCTWSRSSTARRCAALCSTTSSPTQRCKLPCPRPPWRAPRGLRARVRSTPCTHMPCPAFQTPPVALCALRQ
jgi:hypothetical protein